MNKQTNKSQTKIQITTMMIRHQDDTTNSNCAQYTKSDLRSFNFRNLVFVSLIDQLELVLNQESEMILHVFRCRFLFLSLLFSHSFLCSCSLLTVFSFFILWFCVLLKRVEYISIDISTSGAMSALVFNIQQSPFSTL